MFAGSMPNSVDLLARWWTRRRSAGPRASSLPRPSSSHAARGLRVRERLERGERLRRDDEKRLGRVEVSRRFVDVGAVDVRHEAARQRAVAESLSASYAIAGPRSEPPMPMLTMLRDPLAGEALPGARAHPLGEVRHLVAGPRARRERRRAPSTRMRSSRGARSATCSTARSSVTLIRSPENIASMRSRRPGRARPARRAVAASRP